MTHAEIYAQFLAAAMQHFDDTDPNTGGTWHYAERAIAAAKLADYMLEQFNKRFPKYKAAQ